MNKEKVSRWSWCLNPGLQAPEPYGPSTCSQLGQEVGLRFPSTFSLVGFLAPWPCLSCPSHTPFLLHLLPLSCRQAPLSIVLIGTWGPRLPLMALQLGSGTRARLTQSQSLASAATRPEGMEMRNSWSPPLQLAPHPALLRAHHLGCYHLPCLSACRKPNTFLVSKNPLPLQSQVSFLHPTSSLGL